MKEIFKESKSDIGMIKIICVCGARPNFMKISPIMRAFEANGGFETLLVHTGQHYDENMSKLFFDELGIRRPDINLEVGSESHAVQTAEIMKRFEPVVLDYRPDYVLVVGDVNSTIACGLVAVKLGVKLIHVEAGLRSFDRTMPEYFCPGTPGKQLLIEHHEMEKETARTIGAAHLGLVTKHSSHG